MTPAPVLTTPHTDRIPIQLSSRTLLNRRGEPVTCGLPWPCGQLHDLSTLRLTDEAGVAIPVQSRCLDRWPDGSVRWSLLDWQAHTDGPTQYRVNMASDDQSATIPSSITVRSQGQGLIIDTGAACFEIQPEADFPFASIQLPGREIERVTPRLTLTGYDSRASAAQVASVTLDEAGPIRCSIRIDCQPVLGCQVFAYVHFFAGSATVRMHVTVRNPRPASHPGGLWDLGDAGSVILRDVSLTVPLPHGRESIIRCSPEVGANFVECPGELELYQDSSGGENWQSHNHLDRRRVVPTRFRGYRLRTGIGQSEGLRATPIVSLDGPTGFRAASVPLFWENFPKAIEALTDTLIVRLLPARADGGHELQGGEQKTHRIYLAFDRDGVTEEPLAWTRDELLPQADAEWYAASGALPHLTPRRDDPNAMYLALVDQAIEGEDSFFKKRETVDEYGWRHYGDIYGDHEAVFTKGTEPLTSHYNNQYDAVNGFGMQFLRSGDRRWWEQMRDLASHTIDIDTYHTDGDKAAYNRGLFWHTYHYVDADTGTHRSYPARAGVCGGGPSCEHNYTSGLMLWHFLTGDPQARETALDSARWVVSMDDGRTTPFRWLTSGRTGFASSSGNPMYHGPGRGSGNSINALLDGFRLSGDRNLLAKAEEIIGRCVHPADDIDRLELLDAERRWYYTVFLQAVGKYLDLKVELGESDRPADYARETLLHYARWMAEYEYPYLDKPSILEYPTETWAAQDMRKCEVFQYAWKYADRPADRERFAERASYFFENVCQSLCDRPTRGLCRPVVLLLSYGHSHAHFQKSFHEAPLAPLPPARPGYDHGQPQRFTPQKVIAMRRAKALIGVLAITGIVAAAAVLWWWLG